MFSSVFTIVINLLYVFQNIHIMYERFLTISYSRIKDTGRVEMTSHLDNHTTTDVKPEMIAGV